MAMVLYLRTADIKFKTSPWYLCNLEQFIQTLVSEFGVCCLLWVRVCFFL